MTRRLGFIPNLDPLSEVVNGKKDGSAARESLRALGEDGWWTQARLLSEGFPGVEDDLCRACSGEPYMNKAVGTLYHRCVTCPASRGIRRAFKDQEILHHAQSALKCGMPLFVHGVPPMLQRKAKPLFVERWRARAVMAVPTARQSPWRWRARAVVAALMAAELFLWNPWG